LWLQSLEQFRSAGDLAGQYLAWSCIVDSHAMGEWDQSLGDTLRLYNEITQVGAFPSEQIEARVLTSLVFALSFAQPQNTGLITATASRAIKLATAQDDASLLVQAAVYLSVYQIWSGDYKGAAVTIGLLKQWSQSPEVSPLMRLTALTTEALHNFHTADFTACFEHVSKGRRLAQDASLQPWALHLLGHGAASALSIGDSAAARRLLSEIEPLLNRTSKYNIAYYHFLSTWQALADSDLQSASMHIELTDRFANVFPPYVRAMFHCSVAQIHHLRGEEHLASERLAQAFAACREADIKIVEYICLLMQAWFEHDKGSEAEMCKALRNAFSIGREKGYVNFYWWRPAVMSRLCSKALEHNIEPDYARMLIKKRGLLPNEDQPQPDAWPFPIKIYTMGRFNILKDGKPLKPSGMGQKRPFEVLKAIIALGGNDVPQPQIIDLLWTDADGDAAFRSFLTALHRLRKLIGYKDAIKVAESRLTLNPAYIWVSSSAFERLLNQAEEAEKKGDAEKACNFRIKAMDCYSGLFLEKDEYDWAIDMRERLRDKFMRSIDLIGRYWEAAGDFDNAVESYNKALEIDSLAELFYQRLMQAYQRLGRNNEAIALYHRCSRVLSEKMGVSPSPATEKIYNDIQKSR
jgi:DNA-binding SARP family transcriptional activator